MQTCENRFSKTIPELKVKASNPNSPLHQTLNLNLYRASASLPPDFSLTSSLILAGQTRKRKGNKGKNTKLRLCGERGSNTRPSDLQSDALPTELSPQIACLFLFTICIYSVSSKKFFHVLSCFKSCNESFEGKLCNSRTTYDIGGRHHMIAIAP